MRISYPSSFLKLLLIGFALAMLPLLVAFGNAALYLDRLAEQSRNTVYQAVEATRASRALSEQLTIMERSVRQYLVLGDAALLENYRTAHRQFASAVKALQALPLDQEQRQRLESLSKRELAQHDRIAATLPQDDSSAPIVVEFIELSDQALAILSASNQLIDRESAVLAQTAERAQKVMLWQILTLIPVALLVAVAITLLLARPIRRMDSAINRLGEGKYEDTIAIDGPGDLRRLGERLEWLRTQLSDLEEQKKRFLRHVSHELKTPLTSIREGSELLAEQVGGTLSPQQREITAILRDNSLRLQKMIENLIDYTAVQFRKPTLLLERIDCKPLVLEAVAAHALTLDTKQIAIITELADMTLEGDRKKLLTVIDNLISNAAKYTPRGGSIQIRLSPDDGHALLEIADSGPGIAPAERERLFDPFFRGSGSHDSHVSGSGLGLSIAREYVTAHGGTIALLPSDRGALFRMTLPLSVQAST
ncbi:MAG TPA: ATP-binding protein [Methylophilaceae bacterium]|nr:ATP-binding protein [Methylophilaceae bacterium]